MKSSQDIALKLVERWNEKAGGDVIATDAALFRLANLISKEIDKAQARGKETFLTALCETQF